MSYRPPPALRRHLAALRLLLVFTVVTGVAYPLAVTGVALLVLPGRAEGSLLRVDGRAVASRLIGQSFDRPGAGPARPDPRWFQPRPSAAGPPAYDGTASGASNLGPDNPVLVERVRERRAAVAAFDGVPPRTVPADALTASGSGLDPHISPAYAQQQAARVARARGLAADRVRALVAHRVEGRDLGFLGEPGVNVVELNLALDRLG
ncbi:potassium-transporting ATPase subunit KdpC [Streptomyces clavuligerus]|uniref:Potassium-transporting ATPase KdpC subunit n=1 Tax=Streptomyces clavuligerus TaxID=1901 RepID=E2Q1F5_STRCL|nr:potassium-transporting ATPase subunit KdpC [Streptomyces clavuligerus]ANW16896.1 K+-transporting ATPase subunit C [Streptomyces clavuligerus]AXU11426.1 potassium-transporting ATPase subunit KdpC [Streptomyces clavuligerus]EFG10581.1 Putative potassium-transporting ATPase C chain,P-type ATPase [Streptomyces clavuligerus]MBY6301244.1 potassium-transporting ATPase subunit KdpC [Streptomyces clavuligerus]QCS04297.1 potassium-transporting ATPase subunit KdpC [Streptomyces clavuligerus]